MDSSDLHAMYSRSHLFTVRLWVEELSAGQREVRMQVKHVLSGETAYFRDWSDLTRFLLTKVQKPDSESWPLS